MYREGERKKETDREKMRGRVRSKDRLDVGASIQEMKKGRGKDG